MTAKFGDAQAAPGFTITGQAAGSFLEEEQL
jgi:hypothetical protein